jgi:carboxyl-terminal processing protease
MKRKLAVLLFLLISVYVWSDRTSDARQLQRFWEARGKIIGMYVDTVNEDKMTENAIIGMLENLDPHSVYINKDEKAKANEPLVGNFEGIGVQFIMLKDTLHVEAVIPGGPSERVGLLAGGRIVMVDDSIIAGVKMSSVDVMKRLRGRKEPQLRLGLSEADSVNCLLSVLFVIRFLFIVWRLRLWFLLQ